MSVSELSFIDIDDVQTSTSSSADEFGAKRVVLNDTQLSSILASEGQGDSPGGVAVVAHNSVGHANLCVLTPLAGALPSLSHTAQIKASSYAATYHGQTTARVSALREEKLRSPPSAVDAARAAALGPLAHAPLALPPAGAAAAPSASLLKSLLPVGAGAEPLRVTATLSTLAIAFRQLELVGSHRTAELSRLREERAEEAANMQALAGALADARETNGFLRHCFEQLSATEGGAGGVLTLPSLSVLRGEALHLAADRLRCVVADADAARQEAEETSAALAEARAWQGAGLAGLREEVARLNTELAASSALASARVNQAGALSTEAGRLAGVAGAAAAAATAAQEELRADLQSAVASVSQLRAALTGSTAREADLTRRLDWAEEAIGLLKGEIAARDSLLAAQAQALEALQRETGRGWDKIRAVEQHGVDPVTAALIGGTTATLDVAVTAVVPAPVPAVAAPSLAPVTALAPPMLAFATPHTAATPASPARSVASTSCSRHPLLRPRAPEPIAVDQEVAKVQKAAQAATEEAEEVVALAHLRAAQHEAEAARVAASHSRQGPRPRAPVRVSGAALDAMELSTGSALQDEEEVELEAEAVRGALAEREAEEACKAAAKLSARALVPAQVRPPGGGDSGADSALQAGDASIASEESGAGGELWDFLQAP